jgi:hypothetical protein
LGVLGSCGFTDVVEEMRSRVEWVWGWLHALTVAGCADSHLSVSLMAVCFIDSLKVVGNGQWATMVMGKYHIE